jgi:hypothetical protein
MFLRLTREEGQARDRCISDRAVNVGQRNANRVERKTVGRCAQSARNPPEPTGQQLTRQAFGPVRPKRCTLWVTQDLHFQRRAAGLAVAVLRWYRARPPFGPPLHLVTEPGE